MGNLSVIQAEQGPWIAHNFGDKRPDKCDHMWQSFAGIVEEFGELDAGANTEEVIDAIGDAMIFAIDYATAMGWNFEEDIWRKLEHSTNPKPMHWLSVIARSNLKIAQGIRGSVDIHKDRALVAMRKLVWILNTEATIVGTTAANIAWNVWSEVRKRDWKAYPDTGLPPSNQSGAFRLSHLTGFGFRRRSKFFDGVTQ